MVGGAGDSAPYSHTGIHVHSTCASVSSTCGFQSPWRMGENGRSHTGEFYGPGWWWSTVLPLRFFPPDYHLSKEGQDVIQLFSQIHKLWDSGFESFIFSTLALSRLREVPSAGEIFIFLPFQYLFPPLNSQNFFLSLFLVLSWRLF